MSERIVLVAGATGNTGQRIVRLLAARGFHVRTIVRDEEKGRAVLGPEVELAALQLTDTARLADAANGVDAVISAVGTKSLEDLQAMEDIEVHGVRALIKAAEAGGARQFVLISSMGAETPEMIPPIAEVLRRKRIAEQSLEASNIPYTIIRPGALTDEPGGGGVVLARYLRRGGSASRDDVAMLAVQALIQPASQNRIVEVINDPAGGPADRPDLYAE